MPFVAAAFVGEGGRSDCRRRSRAPNGQTGAEAAPMYLIAAAGFVAIFLFKVTFPIIIAGAALVGLIGGMTRPDLFLEAAAVPRWRRNAVSLMIWRRGAILRIRCRQRVVPSGF